jgi:hypothetical protein
MAKKSVDEVWKQLNSTAGGKPGVKRQVDKLWNSFSNDRTSSGKSTQCQAGQLDPSILAHPSLAGRKAAKETEQQRVQKPVESSIDQGVAAVSVERALQMMQDPNPSTRRMALGNLQVSSTQLNLTYHS